MMSLKTLYQLEIYIILMFTRAEEMLQMGLFVYILLSNNKQ